MEDGLPRLICKECCRHLKRAYAFNIQCEASYDKLRYYLQESEDRDCSLETTQTLSKEYAVKSEGNEILECKPETVENNKFLPDSVFYFKESNIKIGGYIINMFRCSICFLVRTVPSKSNKL